MSLPKPLPVAIVGKSSVVGKPVSQLMMPEIEVVHFMTSFEAAKAELPDVVAGIAPKCETTHDVGTHDYSKPIRAVITGRAFTQEQADELREACKPHAKFPMAWVSTDPNTPPPTNPGPDYAKVVAADAKAALAAWIEAGGKTDEVIVY